MTQGQTNRLSDLQPVQGFRQQDADFSTALAQDRTDPFPHGGTRAGYRGSTSVDSHMDRPALALMQIRSMDGGLPDHLIEEMLRRLHEDDRSLYDFLGMFDKRLNALALEVERQTIAVSALDAGNLKPTLLDKVARLSGGNRDAMQLSPELLSRSRSLTGLRRALMWWTSREVSVKARFDRQWAIDAKCRTSLGRQGQNNRLRHGALLGGFGRIAQGRIEIEIFCADRPDFDALRRDGDAMASLRKIVQTILRYPTPFSIYAVIPRNAVGTPCVSARAERATRLGEYNCLGLSRVNALPVRIKLRTRPRAA
jgi:predicted component of type VI protein secretion system